MNVDSSLPGNANALFAEVQRTNCSLAIVMANAFLRRRGQSQDNELSDEDVKQGIEEFSWPSRFEIIRTGTHERFLDGAHNELSIGQAVEFVGLAQHSVLEVRKRRGCHS